MSTIQERARRVVEEFSTLTDPIDRYRRLVAMGDAMPRLEAGERTEANRLPGCQYAVWLRSTYDPADETLRFRADSDARITRGLAALIIGIFDGACPSEVAEADLGFLDDIGLREQLSVHRGGGLSALIDEVRVRARLHLHEGRGAA
jgi:cysteine desulfuration protein SufE